MPETYDDVVFALGDLAREVLVDRSEVPRSLQRVLRAEQVAHARREELAALEDQLNAADRSYRDDAQAAEDRKARLEQTLRKHKQSLDAIEGKLRQARKQVATKRAELRYLQAGLEKEEAKHEERQVQDAGEAKLAASAANLKKLRLQYMRARRDLEELEAEVQAILRPPPGHPVTPGLDAQRRLFELEDQVAARKEAYEGAVAALDEEIAAKESESKAADEFLDQALYMLGEECYQQRLKDPRLNPLYAKLDRLGG